MFEGRRDQTGGSFFALDNIIIPETACTDSPLYPRDSPDSSATGRHQCC